MKKMTDLLPSTLENPDAEAVSAENGSRTWRKLESNARRFANALESLGLGIGDRWALLSYNRVEWAELILGNVRAGTRYIPLNWYLMVPDLEYLLRDSGATMLIVDPANEEKGRAAARTVGIEPPRIFVLGPEFEAWLSTFPETNPRDDIAGSYLLYTGGTTGTPKGVIRSDTGGPFSEWVEAFNFWSSQLLMPEKGTGLISTPLFHTFGSGLLAAFLARRHRVIIKTRFEPIDFLATVEEEGITSAPIVPTQIVRLAKLPQENWARFDTSSLKWVIHTEAPCPGRAKQTLINHLGPIVVEFYGSTEGTGPVSCTSQEWMFHPGTVGRPKAGLQAKVVDDDGNDLPSGSIGSLYFRRGDGLPIYYGDPEKTEKSRLPGGWFTVGDMGWIDSEGFIYLADRRVDMIICGGVNVYTAGIEGILIEHPWVRDAAVFSVPDPEIGEQVKGAVELQEGVLLGEGTAAELISWCMGRMVPIKCPKSIDFHKSLPRDPNGKLKKRFLKEIYWKGQPK
jgi:long-chain acyl-CoA synthetase